MRILVDGMPRTMGGIGSLILNLADYSRECGDGDIFQFDFIIAGRSGYLPILDEKKYKYHIAPPVHEIREYRKFLMTLFEENHFDVLWFNNTSKVNIVLPIIAKKHGTKVISHPHGVDIEEKGLKRYIFKLLNKANEKKMFSLIDIPFACSEEAADVYYINSKLRDDVIVIKNGVNTKNFVFDNEKRREIREDLKVSDSEVLLGAVGRLTDVKNYPFIISMMEKLDTRFKLIIMGDGEEKNSLQKYIDDRKLTNRCRLLGSKRNVADYLSAMDLFLLPSINEGMPYSVIEAQCEGLPCVVSNSLTREIAITDLVKYVSTSDTEQWAKAVEDTTKIIDRGRYRERVIKAGYSIENAYSMFKHACEGSI